MWVSPGGQRLSQVEGAALASAFFCCLKSRTF